MEGPTPVSALIHAATMVTAGVYLIVRTTPLFELAPVVQDLAAGLGAATLLIAGLIALVQTDIKRVIAYSTMSQIGYMFLGVGLGAYANGMFHLMTHAFFKALLFMAAGIVIHALAGEQDIRKMGGSAQADAVDVRRRFLSARSRSSAIPPFSGFFSKDSILAAALAERLVRRRALGRRARRRVPDGPLHVPDVFMVFGGEPSAFVREHFHALNGGLVGISMARARRGAGRARDVGGWIQFAPFWTPISNWLEPVAPPLVRHPGSRRPSRASARVVARRSLGIGDRVVDLLAPPVEVPRPRPCSVCSSTSSTSTSCTTRLFYGRGRSSRAPAPASSRARSSAARSPSSRAALGTGRAAPPPDRARPPYALALAAGVAVLVVVFVAVR